MTDRKLPREIAAVVAALPAINPSTDLLAEHALARAAANRKKTKLASAATPEPKAFANPALSFTNPKISPSEFILWMHGFLDGIGDTLNSRQVAKIHEKIALVDSSPTSTQIQRPTSMYAAVVAAPNSPPDAPFSPGELPQVVRMG